MEDKHIHSIYLEFKFTTGSRHKYQRGFGVRNEQIPETRNSSKEKSIQSICHLKYSAKAAKQTSSDVCKYDLR